MLRIKNKKLRTDIGMPPSCESNGNCKKKTQKRLIGTRISHPFETRDTKQGSPFHKGEVLVAAQHAVLFLLFEVLVFQSVSTVLSRVTELCWTMRASTHLPFEEAWRSGKSSLVSKKWNRWFVCICLSYPSIVIFL